MSSAGLVEGLEVLQPFVYGLVALAAVVQWRRRPDNATAWLAATFLILGLVLGVARLLPEGSDSTNVLWARKALVAILVLFPYCLYRFMSSLIRPIPLIWITAPILTAGVALGALVLPSFPESGEPQPGWFRVYVAALLIQWVFLTGVVAVRLWRAGRGQATLARRRMRTMSAGATGLALALVVAGEFPNGDAAAALVQLLALGAAPLMLFGFAPPYALRVVWHRPEESVSREATISLMGATTVTEVAGVLLPLARRLVGAAAVALEDTDGGIVARHGPEDEEILALSQGGSGALVTIPMSSGRLRIVTSPFTPFFGGDEMARLEELAGLADLALARNELLDSQRRLAAIVESAEEAILAKALDGTIMSWNHGAERLYGYRPEEVVGRSIAILVPPDIENDVPRILEKVAAGERINHYETKRRTKDGRTLDVSLTVSPIRNALGKVTGASTIARDITERKEMEGEREAAREEADRSNRAKSDFLSRMSHELRTPLNAVLGFAQLLDMDALTPEQREATQEIIKAGKHLVELIDEVLDISRIEAGRLRLSLEPVDAIQAVEECISLLTPLANEEGVKLTLEQSTRSVYVIADRQRLKQVLLNLIANGIKYNRQNGKVRIVLEPTGQGLRERIAVVDTGRGIPAERMEQLFDPFERLGAEESHVAGTGLGLALSKRLVEAMGGTISVVSEPGAGSTFAVELAAARETPVDVEDQSPPAEENAPSPTSTSRTILYIEDNLSNLKLVERLVARRPGIALVTAMQGSIGMTLARDHRPDLILLDLNLPDITGEEVLLRLHSDPQTAELPIVVISADATEGQIRRLLDAGASDYITKPLNVRRFLQIVDDFCTES